MREGACRGWRRRSALAVAVMAALVIGPARASAQDASSGIYIRTDTDHTTVISPRVRVGTEVAETRVDVAYSADVWTSASIDIATSASKPITEQRDQIDVQLSRELGDTTLSAAYRFSNEPDYHSQGATLGVSEDFAAKSTTLALTAGALFDHVGRAGDPNFWRSLDTFDLRLSGTQILDERTWLQAVYELGFSDGYLASPYRFVAIGAPDATCRTPTAECVRETLPDERLRHALALHGRRALSETWALAASYRFYVDGWSLLSHTAEATLSDMLGADTRLSLAYRFYTQGSATYYRAHIPSLSDLGRYATRDKELSPLSSQRLLLTFQHSFRLGDGTQSVQIGALVGPTLYLFRNFFAYDRLYAFEASANIGVTL